MKIHYNLLATMYYLHTYYLGCLNEDPIKNMCLSKQMFNLVNILYLHNLFFDFTRQIFPMTVSLALIKYFKILYLVTAVITMYFSLLIQDKLHHLHPNFWVHK